jgi:hypothetical protein
MNAAIAHITNRPVIFSFLPRVQCPPASAIWQSTLVYPKEAERSGLQSADGRRCRFEHRSAPFAGANAKKIPEIDIDEDEVTLKGNKEG